jgi:hypothetical protein
LQTGTFDSIEGTLNRSKLKGKNGFEISVFSSLSDPDPVGLIAGSGSGISFDYKLDFLPDNNVYCIYGENSTNFQEVYILSH